MAWFGGVFTQGSIYSIYQGFLYPIFNGMPKQPICHGMGYGPKKSSGHSKRGDGAPEEGRQLPPFREEAIVGEDNIVGSTYIYTLW